VKGEPRTWTGSTSVGAVSLGTVMANAARSGGGTLKGVYVMPLDPNPLRAPHPNRHVTCRMLRKRRQPSP